MKTKILRNIFLSVGVLASSRENTPTQTARGTVSCGSRKPVAPHHGTRCLTNNPMKTKTSTINVSPRFSLRLAPTLVVAAVFILSVAAQLAYASPGDLFVSDSGSNNIYEFTPGGTRSTFATGLNGPVGLAFDSAGNLFEADFNSGNIYEFTPGGTRSTFASGLNEPVGLAFDSAGNLFEADFGSGNIYEFTPGGTRSTFASGLNEPYGLAFNSAGNLFEADFGSGNIYEFTPGGTRTFASGLFPEGLAFNSAGNLFDGDGSGNIYEFTPGGTRSTFASGLGPEGLAFNSAGNLFEADNGSGNIYEFTPGGTRSTFASGLNTPTFLAFQPVPAVQVSAAVSRKTHGAAGDFDINMPLTGSSGVECRSGGATHDYSLVVTFSGNVTVTGMPQAQVVTGTGCVGSGGTCNPNGTVTISGNIVTVPLTNIADVQVISVQINGVNSASDEPAVNVNIPMGFLVGDVTGNRTVNASDVALTKSQVGQNVGSGNFREDVNANGTISSTDVAIVKSDVGHALPP